MERATSQTKSRNESTGQTKAGAKMAGKLSGASANKTSAIQKKAPAISAKSRVPTRLSSVAMAVRLLKSFSEGEAEIGVTNLSRRLNIAKSTVYRLASTLVAEGMLEQNRENEKYRLGTALFGLGA